MQIGTANPKPSNLNGKPYTCSDAAGVAHVPTAGDEIQQLSFFSASHKLRAAAAMCMPDGAGGGGVKGLCALSNNALEVWEVGVEKGAEAVLGAALYQPGHRSDVRAVALSNDDTAVAACAGGELKVWNLQSGHCFRSLASGYLPPPPFHAWERRTPVSRVCVGWSIPLAHRFPSVDRGAWVGGWGFRI